MNNKYLEFLTSDSPNDSLLQSFGLSDTQKRIMYVIYDNIHDECFYINHYIVYFEDIKFTRDIINLLSTELTFLVEGITDFPLFADEFILYTRDGSSDQISLHELIISSQYDKISLFDNYDELKNKVIFIEPEFYSLIPNSELTIHAHHRCNYIHNMQYLLSDVVASKHVIYIDESIVYNMNYEFTYSLEISPIEDNFSNALINGCAKNIILPSESISSLIGNYNEVHIIAMSEGDIRNIQSIKFTSKNVFIMPYFEMKQAFLDFESTRLGIQLKVNTDDFFDELINIINDMDLDFNN